MTPKPGTTLHSEWETGTALVVEEGTTQLTALLDALFDGYGGERFSESNPVIVEAAPHVKVDRWFYCTKAWREAEGVDWEGGDWWAPHGDGKRFIWVAYIEDDLYDIGDAAALAEDALAVAASPVGEQK